MGKPNRFVYTVVGIVLGVLLTNITIGALDGLRAANVEMQAKSFEEGRLAGVADGRAKEKIYYCIRGMFILKSAGVISADEFADYQGDCESNGAPQ